MAIDIVSTNYHQHLQNYLLDSGAHPLFICGEAFEVLSTFPDETFDFCMTSPPYWGKRQYSNGGIGLEKNYHDYIENLLLIFTEVKRVLKPTGSFWLNIGDSYLRKRLLGIPWRVTLKMCDRDGWILRNQVVWNKIKGGPDNSKDKLRNVHELIFHFVKRATGYYYDVDAIRTSPRKAKVVNGSIVSATGVTGVRYRRQIELSTLLTKEEKKAALKELDEKLEAIRRGELADFRMIIRGIQRTTHSNSEKVSGRARELQQRGFYFLLYNPKGSKPSDVWDIIPEDVQKRSNHYAAYPKDLCRIPLLATCPENGLVLDPFCGTGTTNIVASEVGRKSVGIDISQEYLEVAKSRGSKLR